MDLTLAERSAIMGMLPGEGRYDEMATVHELRMALSRTFEADRNEGHLVFDANTGQAIKADDEHVAAVSVTGAAVAVIVKQLKDLEQNGKITDAHLPLWRRFVLAEVTPDDALAAVKEDE